MAGIRNVFWLVRYCVQARDNGHVLTRLAIRDIDMYPPSNHSVSNPIPAKLLFGGQTLFVPMIAAFCRSALPSVVARLRHSFLTSLSPGFISRTIRAFGGSRVSLAITSMQQRQEDLRGRLLDGKLIARYGIDPSIGLLCPGGDRDSLILIGKLERHCVEK